MTSYEPSDPHGPQPPPPYGRNPYQPAHEQPRHTPPGRSRASVGRRNGGLLVVAALLAGGLGGIAGAAAYLAVEDEPATAGPVTSTGDTLGARTTRAATIPNGSVPGVAASVLPSVVKINVATSRGAGSGSGVVLSSDGQILTNNHVVEAAIDGGLTVAFDDGSTAPASIVGTDPLTDLAVIQAEDVSGLDAARIGSSGDLTVGQEVVAVGSPFGLESTVTSGIVSALDRPVDTGGTQGAASAVIPAIQTDAAINPGNSGGPLVDAAGQVVGINTAIRTASTSAATGGSIGLGFAIPIDQARAIVAELSQGQPATHARIGVSVSDAVDDNAVVTGARVEKVIEGDAGEEAGLRVDDVVVRVGGDPISSSDDLVATVRSYRPGDTVTVAYLRDGDLETAEVVLDSDEGIPTS